MSEPPSDPREMGFYFALAQVGFEFVIPAVIGILIDRYFGWSPWFLVVGVVVGFVGGLFHLVSMLNKHDRQRPTRGKPHE